jgi:alpha-1,2-mannosyltransferase
MRLTVRDRRRARIMALEHGLLILLPIIWTIALVHIFWSRQQLAFDFHHYYWPAGDRALHGLSPYIHGPWYPSEVPVGFVYPAPAAVLFAAVSIIPRDVGDWIFTALSIAAPLAALRVLQVRDWRPYGVVMLWLPVSFGWQCANLSMLMLVAVAGLWRARDRSLLAGVLLAVIVALKLFLFPLGVFFLATRRYVALAYGVLLTLAVSAASWLALGVDELPRYRGVLRHFTQLREHYGYSLTGYVERLGAGRTLAYAIPLALAGALVIGSFMQGRRRREESAFILVIAASLVATPILWLHYLVLLAIPIAIRRPRLHPLWLLPLLLWYGRTTDPSTSAVAVALAVSAAVVAGTVLRPERRRGAAAVAADPALSTA